MKRIINSEHLLIGLIALLIGTGLYFLISHLIDCSKGHDVYSEVIITDKQFQEAWTEVYTTIEAHTINGHTYSHPVVRTRHHAARYLLHYSDQPPGGPDGYRTTSVGAGLYHHYRVGDRARLRTRLGKSGCTCGETVL